MSAEAEPKQNRIEVLDTLRAVACLTVCLFHFALGNPSASVTGWPRAVFGPGWRGVEIFFVISGFIIPYSLAKTGYSITDLPRFLARRIVRLDPPYIASISIVVALAYVSAMMPGFRGVPLHLSIVQVLLHLGYLNVFFNYPWLNPVFWTLAIEFQFYFLMGLAFPLLSNAKSSARYVLFALLALFAILIPSSKFVFSYLFLFMMGMAAFQLSASLISRTSFYIFVIMFVAGCSFALDFQAAVIGALTSISIVTLSVKWWPLTFVGRISYSLYLLHVPIGGRVVGFLGRYADRNFERFIIMAIALAVSLALSYLLYLVVEAPSQRLASRISYGRKRSSLQRVDAGTTVTPVPEFKEVLFVDGAVGRSN